MGMKGTQIEEDANWLRVQPLDILPTVIDEYAVDMSMNALEIPAWMLRPIIVETED